MIFSQRQQLGLLTFWAFYSTRLLYLFRVSDIWRLAIHNYLRIHYANKIDQWMMKKIIDQIYKVTHVTFRIEAYRTNCKTKKMMMTSNLKYNNFFSSWKRPRTWYELLLMLIKQDRRKPLLWSWPKKNFSWSIQINASRT